jgi:hypothetical protein
VTPRPLFDPRDFRRAFPILLAMFSIFYFSELANFSLSIDEEKAILREDAAVWIAQERWLCYLIERFILPPPVVPFFPLFLFGALASLGYIVLARAHQYRLEEWPVLLVFVLFSAFPILYFVLDFSFVAVSFGIGILLSCLCLFLFDRAMERIAAPADRRGGWTGPFAIQVLAGAAAVGVYQSLILLIAVGCCGIFLLRYLRGPEMSLRQILLVHAYLACGVAGSVILSFLISRGFQWLVGVQPTYIARFVQPDQLLDSPLAVLRRLIKEYWAIYGGKRAVYGFRYVTFPALILLGMFALAARARRDAGSILFVILYMLGMTLIPFAINPVSGGDLPYRTLVAVPYVFWFFAAGAVAIHVAFVRRIAIALVIVVAIQCLFTFSTFQAEKRLVLDHDKLLASELYQRIVGQIPDFDRSKTYTIDFYGAHEFQSVYKEIDGSTLSGSFFEWDDGNPGRMVDFMRILGYANFVRLDRVRQQALLPVMQAMPIWPAEGSVKLADGIILVRLGEKPGVFHKKAIEAAGQP